MSDNQSDKINKKRSTARYIALLGATALAGGLFALVGGPIMIAMAPKDSLQ